MNLGLITYHSAYNFGSAMQAYATQNTLAYLDHQVDLINYRMEEQYRFYRSLYRTSYGVKTWIKDLFLIPCHNGRLQRIDRFEKFFVDYFTLTSEVKDPEVVAEQCQQYDAIISGSDQIWNKHSCELEHNDWRYMEPYLLKGFNGRKISYASSVGNMTDEELQRILPELRSFDALSFRESSSAEKMTELLSRPVETVLDPTFLLTKDDWISNLKLRKNDNERYILVYSLGGPKQLLKLLPVISKLAKKRDCKAKIVTPFAYLPYPGKHIEYHLEYGPIEFLNALYNAEAVVTDSYHGTVLSVNFGKDFYSVCKSGGSEFRKTDILDRLGLHERIVYDVSTIPELCLSPIDYAAVYDKLDELRQHSLNYLKTALKG